MEVDKLQLGEFIANKRTTLYLNHTCPHVSLKKERFICIDADEEHEAKKVKIDDLRRMVVVGRFTNIDTEVLYRLMIHHIPIDFLDIKGNPQGMCLATNYDDGDFYMGVQQLFRGTPAALSFAKEVIISKIANCKEVIRRKLIDSEHKEEVNWKALYQQVIKAKDVNNLLGAEGIAAKTYFDLWNGITKDFPWNGRMLHPAIGEINYILSFGYNLLRNRLSSSMRTYGINPRVGYFHAVRGRHCALASDLMEQFRPWVDATVLKIVRKGIIHKSDFILDAKTNRVTKLQPGVFQTIVKYFEEMFNSMYTTYQGQGDHWVKCYEPLNDLLDDCAINYGNYLKGIARPCTWRLVKCNIT